MDRPSAVCLSIDGLQAGFLGSYGNTWVQTPAIDRLSSRAFVFDQAYGVGAGLEQAFAALWQGLEATSGFDPAKASLPKLAQAAGVATRLVTDDAQVAEWGEAAGFGSVTLVKAASRRRATETIDQTQIANLLAVAAEEWQSAPRPCLLWVHSQGFSGPWDAPYELRKEFQEEEDPDPPRWLEPPQETLAADADPDHLLGIMQAYAGQLSAIDECAEDFLDLIEPEIQAGRALWTLLAPRGFPLGEHRQVGIDRAARLQGELLHVPCLMRGSGALAEPARSSALVTLVDVPRTLAAWLQLETAPPELQGGLLPLISGEVETLREVLVFQGEREQAVRTPGWFLRFARESEDDASLYAKPDDRWEVNDVHDRAPEVLAELSEFAKHWTADADPEAQNRVAALSEAARYGLG
jgi:arylsulfatase A-like enzyme